MTDPSLPPYQPGSGPPAQYPPQYPQPQYPQQPQYPPQYHPQAGPPPRRRGGNGWIIGGVIAVAVVLLLCVGGVGLYVLTSDDPSNEKVGAAPPAAAAGGVHYAEPPDSCTLLDDSMAESWAGKVYLPVPEENPFPDDVGGDVKGCDYSVRLESVNTVKVFAATNGNAKGRYDFGVKFFKGLPAYVTRPVAGVGTAATGYSQQGAEKRQILAGLILYDNNLYLEIRFLGGGTKPWDANEVEGHLADVAHAIMGKLPKG